MNRGEKMMNTVEQIAKSAVTTKKPNKAEALEIIKDMINNGAGDTFPLEISALYRFFLQTTKKRRPKTEFEWAALALGKANSPIMSSQLFQVRGGYLIATDRYRLHAIPTNKAPGVYDASGQFLDTDYEKFRVPDPTGFLTPDADHQCISMTKKELLDSVQVETPAEKQGQRNTVLILQNRIESQVGIYLNEQYLHDALAYCKDNEQVTIHYKGFGYHMHVTDANGNIAILLPIQPA